MFLTHVPDCRCSPQVILINPCSLTGRTFWDVGGFSDCVRRGTSGNASLSSLRSMIEERAALEQKHADHLSKWSRSAISLIHISYIFSTNVCGSLIGKMLPLF